MTLPPPLWRVSSSPVDYEEACAWMDSRVQGIAEGAEPEGIWLLEHPSLYTLGTSGNPADILQNPNNLPVYETGRGGQVTYHGPGQRIAYVLLNLKARGLGPKELIHGLEHWLILTLATWDIKAFTDPRRIGVWVRREGREEKIAALGVRIRRGVSFHGLALNNAPDLSHFHRIIPCGLRTHQTTSLKELGLNLPQSTIDRTLQETFVHAFPTTASRP